MTNEQWIKSLEVTQDCKEVLFKNATIASGSGIPAIDMRKKLNILRNMQAAKIQEIFNESFNK